ncbi:MAG TPA: hypothetical protein EYO59_07500 [Chromatiaceae bacterium]|nr:hypothetical protein [Chromatiaceae bacterium]
MKSQKPLDQRFEAINSQVEQLQSRQQGLNRCIKQLRLACTAGVWDPAMASRAIEIYFRNSDIEPAIEKLLEQLRYDLDQDVERLLLELDAEIRDLCERHQWALGGQWPTYQIEQSIQVEVDETKKEFRIEGSKLKGVSISELERELVARIKTLIPAKFSPQIFIDLLAIAYDASVSKLESKEAPIRSVYQEMVIGLQRPSFWKDATSTRYVELTASQFRARLTACLKAGVTKSTDGRRLQFMPPIDVDESFFIYQPTEERFAYIGRISYQGQGVLQ